MGVLALAVAGFAGEAAAPGEPAPAKPAPAATKGVDVKMPPAPELNDAQVIAMAKASRLTSDIVRLSVDFIYKYEPKTAQDFMTVFEKDPQKFRTAITEASYKVRTLESLQRSEPARYARQKQMYALEAQTTLLQDRYKDASEAQKPHIEVQLTEVLGRLFELRLEEERYELEQLRKQVDAKQAKIDEKAENKDRIVDRELTRRLGIDEVLQW
jgi:hypothetical protein